MDADVSVEQVAEVAGRLERELAKAIVGQPEGQLDRFMFNVVIEYSSAQEERRMVSMTTGTADPKIRAVASGEEIERLRTIVRDVPAADNVIDHATRRVRATRPAGDEAPAFVRKWVRWGPARRRFLRTARARGAAWARGRVRDGSLHLGTADSASAPRRRQGARGRPLGRADRVLGAARRRRGDLLRRARRLAVSRPQARPSLAHKP
jgi:hypothetical protein